MIYLDNTSTTKPYSQVIESINEVLTEDFGNPSSLHSIGLKAEKRLNSARSVIASSLGTHKENIGFTSGGTEADCWALTSLLKNPARIKGKKILISSIEHPAVYETAYSLSRFGIDVVEINVDGYGIVDTEQLLRELDESVMMVSIMHVNNELGSIQPIDTIGEMIASFNKDNRTEILFHSDAIQSYGKIPIDVNSKQYNNIDLMSLSGHKIHGPKGIGALYIKNPQKMGVLIPGGGQERGLRSGTENLPGIVGFGKAAEIILSRMNDNSTKITELKKLLSEKIHARIPYSKSNNDENKSIPNILNVSIAGTKGEVILHELEKEDIFISTGAACSGKQKKKNRVLKNIGLSDGDIEGTLRFGLSEFTNKEDIEATVDKLETIVTRFRELTRFKP